MNIAESLIKGALIPGSVVLGVLIFEALLNRLAQSHRWIKAVLPLTLGALVGFSALGVALEMPPADATKWIPWLIVTGAVWVLLGAAGPQFWRRLNVGLKRPLLRAVLIALLSAGLLRSYLENFWSLLQAAGYLASLALIFGFLWGRMEDRLSTQTVAPALAGWLTSLTGLSFLLVISGSALMGQLVGVLCSGLGVLWAWSFLFPRKAIPPEFVPVVLLAVLGFALNAHFFVEVVPWHLATVLLPFLWSGRVAQRGLHRRSALANVMVNAMLAAVPVGVALWSAYKIHGLSF